MGPTQVPDRLLAPFNITPLCSPWRYAQTVDAVTRSFITKGTATTPR